MADQKPLKRWTATGDYAFPVEEREDGEFVVYDEHVAVTAPLHAEIERLQEYVREADRRVGEQFMAAKSREAHCIRSQADRLGDIARAEAAEQQRDILAEAIRQYELEMLNPGPDYVMRHQRRKELFEALARAPQPPAKEQP